VLLINTRLQKLFLMIAVVSLFVCGARLDAQTTYGAVRGIVKDAQGAVIAKASVVLTNQETRIARTSVTSGDGQYSFTSIEPGIYTVSVTYTGFKKTENMNVSVETGATDTVDLTLSLGGATETVEVSTTEPLIDTSNANGGQNFDSEQLEELPNLGRNPFVFEKMDTAVTPVGDPVTYVRKTRRDNQRSQSPAPRLARTISQSMASRSLSRTVESLLFRRSKLSQT